MANYSGKGAPANGSVYVCNLPPGTDEDMLAEYFGTIGLLKKDKRTGRPKIWLYRDKVTNEPKGDATVTYEDPYAAQAAVEWFNNKDFHGAIIEVLMAESKNSHNVVAPLVEPSLVDDVVDLEESAKDMSENAGRGRGRGDASGSAPAKAWQQDGDWMCPNTRCGNINWAKRLKCNICNTNKPGVSEGGVRGGRAGGYKELDEEELEETKRRRREAEEDDGEMYDEFGNLKKKFRVKAQQAEVGQVLPGTGRAGWEVEELEAETEEEKGRKEKAARTENDVGAEVVTGEGKESGLTITIETENTVGTGTVIVVT
ncbi:Nucleotide-binding, alpha-beta plait, partial [Cynara cardunculus var. scolymus]